MTQQQGSRPRTARDRAEARRRELALQQQRDARRRLLFRVVVPVVAVVVVVLALVLVKAFGGSDRTSGAPSTTAAAGVISDVTGVPTATFDAVGAGDVKAVPTAVDAPALTAGGLPRVLYVGAEYCPYCAAERWAVVAALARFGTFTDLGQTSSSASDVYPSTATLSFHGASYTSRYLSFTGVETTSNQATSTGYATLDTLSAADEALAEKYDAPPYTTSTGSIPFIDFGGTFLVHGASYDPQVLQGRSHAQIASALADGTSDVARAVDGTANVMTAILCRLTDGNPGAVCTSAGVTSAAAKLGS